MKQELQIQQRRAETGEQSRVQRSNNTTDKREKWNIHCPFTHNKLSLVLARNPKNESCGGSTFPKGTKKASFCRRRGKKGGKGPPYMTEKAFEHSKTAFLKLTWILMFHGSKGVVCTLRMLKQF